MVADGWEKSEWPFWQGNKGRLKFVSYRVVLSNVNLSISARDEATLDSPQKLSQGFFPLCFD